MSIEDVKRLQQEFLVNCRCLDSIPMSLENAVVLFRNMAKAIRAMLDYKMDSRADYEERKRIIHDCGLMFSTEFLKHTEEL